MKKFVTIMLTCLMFIGTGTAFAEETKNINSEEKLENKVTQLQNDNTMSNDEKMQELINSTDSRTLNSFMKKRSDMIINELKEREFKLDGEYKKYSFNTSDGGKVDVTLEDREDIELDTNDEFEKKLMNQKIRLYASNKTGTDYTMFKGFGNRYFTGNCYYQNGFVAVRISIENHYRVNRDKTLSGRYLEVMKAQGFFLYCNVNPPTYVWTKKNGNYINALVTVHVQIGPIPKFGIVLSNFYYKANSKVQIINKKSKGVTVRQSMKWNH